MFVGSLETYKQKLSLPDLKAQVSFSDRLLSVVCMSVRPSVRQIFNVFSLFRYYLILKKGLAPYLNKLESPSPKDAFCQVYVYNGSNPS